jgi:hypothetical protein
VSPVNTAEQATSSARASSSDARGGRGMGQA